MHQESLTRIQKGKDINIQDSSRCHKLQGKIHCPFLWQRKFFTLQWHCCDKGGNAAQITPLKPAADWLLEHLLQSGISSTTPR